MNYYILGLILICGLCQAGPQRRGRIDGEWYPDTENPQNAQGTTPAPGGGSPSKGNPQTRDTGKMSKGPNSPKGNNNGNNEPKFSSITVGDSESASNSSTTYYHTSKNENTRSKWTHFTFPRGGGMDMQNFQPPQGGFSNQNNSPGGSQAPASSAGQQQQPPPSGGPGSQPPGPLASSSRTPENGASPHSKPKRQDSDNGQSGPGSITIGDTEGVSNSSTVFFNDEREEKTNSKWTNFNFKGDSTDSSENNNGNDNGQNQAPGQGPPFGQGQGQGPPFEQGQGQGPPGMNFPSFGGGFPHNMFGGGGGPNMFANGPPNMGNGQNFNG